MLNVTNTRVATIPTQRIFMLAMLLSLLVLAGCASGPQVKAQQAPNPEQIQERSQQLMASADAAWQRGDDERALREYVAIIRLQPDNEAALYRIAMLQDRRGETEAAHSAYADVLKLNPNHAGANEGVGLALLRQKKNQQAQLHLQKAIAADAQRWRAYNALGVLADLEKRSADADSYYRQALQLRPEESMLHSNIAYSNYLDGDYKNALIHLERALKADPNNQTAWANLALVSVRLGRGDQGVRAFTEIMEPYRAHNNIGYLYFLNGEKDKAREHLETAMEMSPSYYALAKQNLDRLQY